MVSFGRSRLSLALSAIFLLLIALQVSAAEVKCGGVAPTTAFNCINGIWTATGDVNITTIVRSFTLATLGTPVRIEGSLIADVIIFSGQPTHLNVSGCIDFNGQQLGFVNFKPSKAVKPAVPVGYNIPVISTYGVGCSYDISKAKVAAISPMGCKNVTVAAVPSNDPSNLIVRFNVYNETCKKLGIIVGSLIGGLVLLTATILGISFLCCKKEKKEYESINYD